MSEAAVSTASDVPDRDREALIEARLALLEAAYPSLVNDESREMIRDEIVHDIERDARLRRFALGNGDEPMALFRPFREADPETGA